MNSLDKSSIHHHCHESPHISFQIPPSQTNKIPISIKYLKALIPHKLQINNNSTSQDNQTMLNLHYLILLLFQLSLAIYFLYHGINLQKNIEQNSQLINKNLHNYFGQQLAIINPYCVQVYAHLQVILAITIVLGWKGSKISSILFYLLNCTLLFENRNQVIKGIQLIFICLIISTIGVGKIQYRRKGKEMQHLKPEIQKQQQKQKQRQIQMQKNKKY